MKYSDVLFQELEKALQDALVSRASSENVQDLFTMVEIDDESRVDFDLFCGICALAERLLFPKFLYVF